MITMVTGGARSGKSTYAEKLCTGDNVVYIACAVITDDEMKERVRHHRAQRPHSWYTLEAYTDIVSELKNIDEYRSSEYILLDCITTMVTNLMMDADIDYDTCTQSDISMVEQSITNEINSLLEHFKHSEKHLIIVTNEVGLGLVPAYRMGRIFRDIAGRANQIIAASADNVYMLISGIAQKIK